MRNPRWLMWLRRVGLVAGGVALLGGLAAAPARGAPPAGPVDPGDPAQPGRPGVMVPGVMVPGDPLRGSGEVDRTLLTAADLTTGVSAGAVPDEAFALPRAAAMPRHVFSGRLDLVGTDTGGGFTILRDDYGIAEATPFAGHLPDFSQEFVQTGSHLIPVVQGLRYTGNEMWNLLVSPGRVWSERGDGGSSRASVPFALIGRNSNCTHNGTLTFLFTDTTISQVRYQITQETCVYFKVDMWGQVSAGYRRHPVPGVEALRAAHATEVARRLPTRPIDALAADYPAAGVDVTAFGRGLTPEHRTVYGLVFRGTNYVSGCTTRQGMYPFCEVMRMPSYSVAKSAFAATTLMRLARTRGPGVARELISRWVPETAGAAGDWSAVTIGDAVDMATGNYESPGYMEDEAGALINAWALAESGAEKMALALSFPNRAAPGTRWVYHTSDTFIAVRAMRNLLGADLFDLVRDQVYIPAGLSRGALTTVRTDNSPTGMPIGGFGLFFTGDDLAKLAQLYQSGGMAGGRQVLDPDLLAAALQRDASERGLPTGDSAGDTYRTGFWMRPLSPTDLPGEPCAPRVAYMAGYGGIQVSMLPNGATYYYVSDNDEFPLLEAAREIGKLAPLCPR